MNLSIPYHLENFIDGLFIGPLSGQFIPNTNPAIGKVYCQIPNSNNKDVDLAVNAAQKAFPQWSKTSTEERFSILNKIANLIDQYSDILAEAETNDQGKPLALSKGMDIARASSNLRFFATSIMHFASESHNNADNSFNYTLRQPIGIVGCISPWNLPLYLFTWKIAPALAAGNCVIAKPSEVTPVTAFLLGKICAEAGLPAGVLNIIHGDGISCGQAIVEHPLIKAISFTGSTRAGAAIASIAAPKFKKLSLELGGKNPNIIFADCNWEKMMETTLKSSFSNQGQICLCGSRILIEKSIYEKFKTEFINRTAQLKVGDPLENSNHQGAIVSKAHFDKIINCIRIAEEEGGAILFGGKPITPTGRCADGYFIQPTIIEGLGPNTHTNTEEIFGPVVTLQTFETIEEAIHLANATHYGLASTIWTENISTANKMSTEIEAGIVWINCWLKRDLRTAFGGVKNSGVGREGGWEALKFFTDVKNICTDFS